MRIARPTPEACVWLLGLDGGWFECAAVTPTRVGRSLSLRGDPLAWAPGTSGSPVLNDAGGAVAIVSVGSALNPVLAHCLPLWLASELAADDVASTGGESKA
jgi:hypothetical protein